MFKSCSVKINKPFDLLNNLQSEAVAHIDDKNMNPDRDKL